MTPGREVDKTGETVARFCERTLRMEVSKWDRSIKPKLEKQQIRLLKLYPSHTRDQVQGSISVVELDSDTPYEAISYVWGDPDLAETITIDRCTVHITSSLYQALLDLRLKTDARIVWIDGICINQDDSEEKSEQVQHMPKIYAKASRVVIHLGPRSLDTDLGLRMLSRILYLVACSKLTENKFLHEDHAVSLGFPPSADKAWDALRSLASQAWFRRTWIVQEFVVAKFAFFLIGDISIPWQVLLFGLHTAQTTGLLFMMPHENRTFRKVESALGRWYQLIRLHTKFQSGIRLPLVELLRVLTKQEVSHPADKLFALQGLSVEAEELAKNIDYSTPLSELFERYASYLVLNGHLQDVLCQAGHAQQTLKLPSWVPDWSGQGRTQFSFARTPTSDDNEAKKGLETRQGLSVLAEYHALRLKASLVDEISRSGSDKPSASNSIPVHELVAEVFGNLPIQSHVSQDEIANLVQIVNMATKNGFKAVVPSHTRYGDVVCSIVGCSALFILRAASTEHRTFHLLGECYIYGIGERSSTSRSQISEQELLLV
jgi:hypothetical protein